MKVVEGNIKPLGIFYRIFMTKTQILKKKANENKNRLPPKMETTIRNLSSLSGIFYFIL